MAKGNRSTYQAAPTTDSDMASPIPRLDHMKGEVSVRNLDTEEWSYMNVILAGIASEVVTPQKKPAPINHSRSADSFHLSTEYSRPVFPSASVL